MALYDKREQDPWEARPYRIILLNVVNKQTVSTREVGKWSASNSSLLALNFFLEKHVDSKLTAADESHIKKTKSITIMVT